MWFAAPYSALGMRSGAIQDNQLSASSVYGYPSSTYYPASQARLGNSVNDVNGREGSFWRPTNSWSGVWIQVTVLFTSLLDDDNRWNDFAARLFEISITKNSTLFHNCVII